MTIIDTEGARRKVVGRGKPCPAEHHLHMTVWQRLRYLLSR